MRKILAVVLVMGLLLLSGCRKQGDTDNVSSQPQTSSEQIQAQLLEQQRLEQERLEQERLEQERQAQLAAQQAQAQTQPPVTTPAPPPTVNRPAAMTEEVYNHLMNLDNTKRGHGWLHSENRQDYFSQFGALTTADRTQPVVYLTFDEGYENGYTPAILDILAQKDVKAVFFVTMSYVKSHPHLVSRMIAEGHVVGNHSVKHKSFPTLDLATAYAEVQELHDYVANNFGYQMTLFRFPMGEHSDRMLALLQSMGYTSVFWNFAHNDWDPANQPAVEVTLERILSNTQNGTIYLLHAVSQSDTAALGPAIDEIRARGYTFALLS